MTVLLCAPGAGRPDSGTTWDTRPALQFRSAQTSGQRAHRPRRAPTTPGRPLAETHAGLGTSRVRAARHAPPARAPPLSGRPPVLSCPKSLGPRRYLLILLSRHLHFRHGRVRLQIRLTKKFPRHHSGQAEQADRSLLPRGEEENAQLSL